MNVFVFHRAWHFEEVLASELAPVSLISVGWLILVESVILPLILLSTLRKLALLKVRLVLRLFLVPKIIALLLITSYPNQLYTRIIIGEYARFASNFMKFYLDKVV